MAFLINGVEPTKVIVKRSGQADVDAQTVQMSTGEVVWQSYIGPPSPIEVLVDSTLIAGIDFPANTEITICACGGGGGGGGDLGHVGGGGGGSGAVTRQHTPIMNATLTITIGLGGFYANTGGTTSLTWFDGITSVSVYVHGGHGGIPDLTIGGEGFNGGGNGGSGSNGGAGQSTTATCDGSTILGGAGSQAGTNTGGGGAGGFGGDYVPGSGGVGGHNTGMGGGGGGIGNEGRRGGSGKVLLSW